MSLLNNLFVGRSGLMAADAGVRATSHNVANISTDGFHRRRIEQSTASPVQRRGLWFGRGASLDRMARPSDAFLARQRLGSAANSGSSSTAHASLSQVEGLFEDGAPTHVRQALDRFFDAMSSATVDPSDPALRRGVAFAGEGVAFAISQTAHGMNGAISDFDARVQDQIPSLNGKFAEVAALNSAIREAGGALSAGDLADQRDLLLRDLATSVGAVAQYSADGQANVFVGGHAVVSEGVAREMGFVPGSDGGPQLTVSADSGTLDVTAAAGGQVGGWLDARERTTDWLGDLNTLAREFSLQLNGRHAAGFDSNGNAGTDLFTTIPGDEAASMTLTAGLLDDPSLLAFASGAAAHGGDDGNLRAMMGMKDQLIINNADPLAFATALAAEVGAEVARSGALAEHHAAVLADGDALDQSLHGVDLDEEATNLLQYQAAYQAAAKVVRTTDELLGTLMELT